MNILKSRRPIVRVDVWKLGRYDWTLNLDFADGETARVSYMSYPDVADVLRDTKAFRGLPLSINGVASGKIGPRNLRLEQNRPRVEIYCENRLVATRKEFHGLRMLARQKVATAVHISRSRKTITLTFENGWKTVVEFTSTIEMFTVVRYWRSVYGAELMIDGKYCGSVSKENIHLIV